LDREERGSRSFDPAKKGEAEFHLVVAIREALEGGGKKDTIVLRGPPGSEEREVSSESSRDIAVVDGVVDIFMPEYFHLFLGHIL
jgi:hypothetical protein